MALRNSYVSPPERPPDYTLTMIDPHTLTQIQAQVHPGARAARAITWDSRLVNEQTAFVALKGENAHGNDFAQQALEKGAPFVLSTLELKRGVQVADARVALRSWARSQRNTHPHAVVGITGSAGKTTAKEYVGAALNAHFTSGNLNTLDAIACFLLEFGGSDKPLVVEMGIDRIGEMAELMALIAPDIGVITAIGEAHLEFFGSLETIAREKGDILSAPRLGLVNARAAHYFPGLPTYGLKRATFQTEGTWPNLTCRGVRLEIPSSSPVVMEAAVLGLALAEQLRISLEEAAGRITKVEVPGGRWKTLEQGGIRFIDDTYNANPISVRAALEGLSQHAGRKIAVLGDMLELGPDSARLHRETGALASSVADEVFSLGEFRDTLSQNPFTDPQTLSAALLEHLKPGDTVLFKASRGVKLERVLEAVRAGLRGIE